MNKRDNILRTLKGENTGSIPATPHWWGLYKFAISGDLQDYSGEAKAWGLSGKALADVDSRFYEAFQPDMFHLSTGASRLIEDESERIEKKRIFDAVYDLESYTVIDEYIEAFYASKEEVLLCGIYDHVRILADKYGQETLILLNEGNPVSWILDPHGCVGFENGLISMLKKPDKMEYLLNRSYEAMLPRIEALREMGADGYIGSETYCSADLISPDLYRSLLLAPQKKFYTALKQMGLIPITYFLGDINPLLEDIKDLGAMGLMVEESKKNFRLDIGDIYQRLERQVCLFGNLDSIYMLQMGSKTQIQDETLRQVSACADGAFIMANGCPISFETPPDNIHTMLITAREYRAR